MYKLLFITALLCYCSVGVAQQSNFLFHRIGIKDGLNQENMFAVCQDKRGFLWFASNNCIQRYDGYRFINFYTGGKGVLPSGVITTIQMDQKGRLWIITGFASLGYFDTDKFTYHPVKVNIPSSFVDVAAGLLIDKADNIILIYVGRGFLTYSEKFNELSQQYNQFTLPVGYEPRHMIQDDDFNYWITSANGFIKYNTKKKLMSYSGHNTENDLLIKSFGSVKNCGVLYTDRLKRFWLSYKNPNLVIKSFDPVDGKIKSWETVLQKSLKGASHDLWGIRQFTDGSLWMNGPGLFAKINYEQLSIGSVPVEAAGEYSIRYDEVGNLFEDREKSIWACTNKGLFRFNPSAQIFRTIDNRLPNQEKIYSTDVTDILETTEGEILVSTGSAGVFSYNKDFNPIVSKYISQNNTIKENLWCVLQTQNGNIWRGGQDGILSIYDAQTKKIKRFTLTVASGKTLRQIVEDKNADVWIGTQGGHLIKWNTVTKQFILFQKFKRLVSRLLVDSHNNIWACTDIDGVYHIKGTDGSIISHYTTTGDANKKLLMNGASDIIEYDDSTIVIASNGLNILNTKTNKFNYWDEGAQITNMVKDKKGNLWLSTNKGIVSRQLSREWSQITFDARDGVSNLNFNVASSALLKNGHISFGTNHDLLVFNPEKAMEFNFKLPEVQMAGIAVMNNWLSVDSVLKLNQLSLPHNKNSITIRFTSNNHQNITPVVYLIEGADKDWRNSTSTGEVSMNYLAPGKYILKATTKDGMGKIGKVITITIVIAAPFYKTWWFYSLIVLAIGTGLFWLDKERMKRREVVSQMRTSIASNLHHQVNTALNSINILSEIAKIKADKDPEKSKEFIEEIHNKSHNTVIAMDDMLWGISPENDSMQKSVARMQEYIDALNNRHDADIEMLVDDGVSSLKLNMQLRYEAFLLFKEGITGLIKLGARACKVYLRREKSHLVYIIECKNNSSDVQQLNYLLNGHEFQNRLQAINATMDIEVYQNISVLRCSIQL